MRTGAVWRERRERPSEDRFERADGTVQWIRWEIIPWRAGDGSVGGIVIFSEDITPRKKAEERLRLAASVFTGAREGITITDPKGTILEVNDASPVSPATRAKRRWARIRAC